ncbi:MAG: hypothetical protein FJ294_11205 [Planctomycetes bacterium]|nr:hypothetical protein [Planctomycetota bacterium]
MRILSALVALALAALPAQAQLLAFQFKDQKIANRYKDHLVLFGGQYVVVGEPYANIYFDAENNRIAFRDPSNRGIAIIVPDPSDPTKVPYEEDGDEKKITGKKAKLNLSMDDIEDTRMYMREGSLPGMAADYRARKALIDIERSARDKFQKGTPDYMSAHQRMLSQMERLQAWLEGGLYPIAAEKLTKEIAKERKLVAAEAATLRAEKARNSPKPGTLHPDFEVLAKEIDPSDSFKQQDSLHCRIVYRGGIDDERVKNLLVLAEEIIDGFRIEFVDPYVDAEFEDSIKEEMFIEWMFNYDDIPKAEKYMTKWYRFGWPADRKDEALKSAGSGGRRATPPVFIYHWRASDDADLEGMVSHNLGHVLANLHFDKGRPQMSQDWLEEGVALYCSLEWLGRNSVNCKAFEEPGKYVNRRKIEGEKTAQMGQRDWYNAMAIEAGAPIDKLVLKTLFEFGDGDLAKSWSFFDWIAKRGGREGQLLLRSCCDKARTRPTFIKDWRSKAEEIYEVSGADVFDVLDKRWKEFAQNSQDLGSEGKRK